MNEWLKNLFEQVKALWAKWTGLQKTIFFSVIGVAVLALVLLVGLSSSPSRVALLGVPIADVELLNRISLRLDSEGIAYTSSEDNRLYVADNKTAQLARSILVRENLVPAGTDPWALFDLERWTLTDFERNVNLRRAITQSLEDHIRALSDVDDVRVTLVMPEDKLFAEDQKPVTASVRITPKPGSDMTVNRKKIEGIQKLIQYAVEGLKADSIVITDNNGLVLNDFTGLADIDRLELAKREMRIKTDLENRYKENMIQALNYIFSPTRIRIVNLDIQLNTDKQTTKREEHFPIVMVPDNPRTPFSELKTAESFVISENTVDQKFQGTGFNPEGPPGMEGQTPPSYKDLEGMVGSYSNTQVMKNHAVNKEESTIEKSPWSISRVTIGVALDGIWKYEYDEYGEIAVNPNGSIKRTYIPLSSEDLNSAKALIEPAVGFNRDRGDAVSVVHVPFDRSGEFEKEDAEYRSRKQMERTILIIIIGMALVIIAFIAFRMISREMERRRRLREEELSRQHAAMREAALRSAEEEGVDVEMSVAERARLELQENAINMAREHPADVAQLIRTWLAEE